MKSFWIELFDNLLGGMSPAYFFAMIIFVLIGASLNILVDVQNRNKLSENSPVTWSWKFFWKDNWFRFLLNLLIAFSVVRFMGDLLHGKTSMFWAFAIGIIFDWMLVVFKLLQKKIKNQFTKSLKE